MSIRWDCSGYEPKNYRRDDAPGVLVFLAGALAGAVIVAPFWIGIFEWLFGGRP